MGRWGGGGEGHPEEFTALVEEIEALVARRTAHTPGDGRVRHLISFALVPDKAGGEQGETP
ncbi:hypothetical protein [Streptomyces koyangensis]|uniref:hypothetical protein n=1 Tax=Streptomyces koyangensis TaxID=188770 RepID=UPI003C2D7EFC